MAFTISRSQSALTEGEKENNVDKLGYKECGAGKESMISSQLQLKSSLSSSQSMDKQAVLRRIRQRRSYNRAKSALKALMGPSEATSQEHKWLQLGDSFSSP